MATQDAASAVTRWEKVAREHAEKQSANPFSQWEGSTKKVHYDKADVRYGRPPEGSSTERRGIAAKEHVDGEILQLCDVIQTLGSRTDDGGGGGRFVVTFGRLFEAYTKISNKVVGILLRARRKGYVTFEGEMLYQGRDDRTVVQLTDRSPLPLPPEPL